MSHEQTKAANYIQQLDEARCNGSWDAVPELLRKVRKHAPNRSCLTLTAECEHAIHESALRLPNSSRPGTAGTARPSSSGFAASPQLSRYVPVLMEEIAQEQTHVEDKFQAEVCLGYLHWHLGEAELAISRLPKNIDQEFSQLEGTSKESTGWTKVCAVKASYIKGTAQKRTGFVAEALESFESAMPLLSITSATHGKELWKWTELFLTEFCILSSYAIKTNLTSLREAEALSAFRAWSNFWNNQTPVPHGGRAVEAEISRRRVWKEYYMTLSDLLQQDLPFPTTSLTTAYKETSTKLQQRAELKRIEAKYEALLLSEIQFPKAQQASEEVETFVEIAMDNWRILCGSNWKEHDLGEGGSEALTRGVLDILYRAATKTFHSTAILRHLFTVHLAIAEFELALKAFDTYLEIVNKGKARVEKTGAIEHGLDDDETVLRTVADCVRALCRYGTRQGAEKAKELGKYLEDWLKIHQPSKSPNGHAIENGDKTTSTIAVRPEFIALTWRSIGICHAQWARVTYDAASRAEIQVKAISSFKKALSPEFGCSTDMETLFALGTILAERRELSAAIEVVKAGLLPRQSSTASQETNPHSGLFFRERKLIPLWHLMALLLSARQEFVTAARSCEGAFEQFQDPKNLFGEENLAASFRSDHLNEKASPRSSGLVDDMDDFEKEGILQVKMTQLALIEVLEGPEVAVNASDELLSLYTRLFGDPQKDSPPPASTGTLVPPKSSADTVRSIRGSIFGRTGRSLRKSNPTDPTLRETYEKSVGAARPQTTHTVASTIAPTIHVTGENGSARQRSSSTKHRHHHEKLQKRNDSVSRKKSTNSRNRSNSTGTNRPRNAETTNSSPKRTSTATNSENHFGPHPTDHWLGNGSEQGEIGIAVTPDFFVQESGPHIEPSLTPVPSDPLISQDSRLPQLPVHSLSTSPLTRFPKGQQRRRRVAVLINVWLLIGGFYRRALLFEDSRGAVDEAQKLVQALQEEILQDPTGAVSVQHVGWGGGKSVGELWGDIYSERGYLAASEKTPYTALRHFESSLTNFADHPSAIVGLSELLLDIYTEKLRLPPAMPPLLQPHDLHTPSTSTLTTLLASIDLKSSEPPLVGHSSSLPRSPQNPLGLPTAKPVPTPNTSQKSTTTSHPSNHASGSKEITTALLDRLAARDRAYGLLSGLTKLGSGWNYSEAWFSLARAYEESGQPDKAREVLWRCVELEEGKGVRSWAVVGSGGYVL